MLAIPSSFERTLIYCIVSYHIVFIKYQSINHLCLVCARKKRRWASGNCSATGTYPICRSRRSIRSWPTKRLTTLWYAWWAPSITWPAPSGRSAQTSRFVSVCSKCNLLETVTKYCIVVLEYWRGGQRGSTPALVFFVYVYVCSVHVVCASAW